MARQWERKRERQQRFLSENCLLHGRRKKKNEVRGGVNELNAKGTKGGKRV